MPCRCELGWTCELHPGEPMAHDGCTGTGLPCTAPRCPFWASVPPAALHPPGWHSIANTREDH